MPVDEIQYDCAWFEDRCTNSYVGMAAHQVYGVIPICKPHADILGVHLITTIESE